MKYVLTLVGLAILLSIPTTSKAQFKGVLNNAKRKVEQETNRKINEGIEDVFDGKEDKKNEPKDKTPSTDQPKTDTPTSDTPPTTAPKENPTNTTTPPVTTTNDPESVSKNTDDESPAPPPTLTTKKSDFTPGDIVLFEDQLINEQLGEFPSKWDLYKGNVEVAQMDGSNVIAFSKTSEIMPLMKTESYLPEVFTIELECYFHYYGNEGYYLNFDKGIYLRINDDNIQHKGNTSRMTNNPKSAGWRTVQLSFNKRALKVYLNGERLINVPNIKEKPTKVRFSALSHGASQGKPSLIRNIRIAEGGIKLYDRLMTDGKIVTNDIQFNYNEATLKPQSMKVIREIVDLMKNHPNLKFNVIGHTDSDGSESYNLKLSNERADAVRIAMINLGIERDRLTSEGKGEAEPISENNSAEGKARNRRVEFISVK